jgi:periplasmic copper chaperone A
MRRRHLLAAALLAASPAAAKAPSLHVEGWARAGASSSAAYVSIHNGGRTADRLLGASTPAARSVSVHRSVSQSGVMRMRAAGPVAVPAGGRIAMQPGGLHLMLTGLKAPLRPGARLPLTLRFERAGPVQASLPVLPPGAAGPGAGGHHGH